MYATPAASKLLLAQADGRETLAEQKEWTIRRGRGPIAAAAIHDGHGLRPEVAAAMSLPEADRLREEDPFTAQAIADVPTQIIAHQSRFEADLNRNAETAVYRTPEQSWGLEVWDGPLDQAIATRSLAYHRRFYNAVGDLLDGISAEYPRFVVLDVHSYNHRRAGPGAPPTPPTEAPEINIGTFSMPREDWAWLLDPLMEEMRNYDFGGRNLDVRENVAFQGKGELTRFVHDRYPGKACAIALEFKKFFMDEWTGEPDPAALVHMRRFIDHTAKTARGLLDGQ